MVEHTFQHLDELWTAFEARRKGRANYGISDFAEEHPEHRECVDYIFPMFDELQRLGKDSSESPKWIDKYAIIHQIGRGGMGAVYEARYKNLRERVAIKVLDRFRMLESGGKRFEREARLAATLHHSNVVPVYDYGEFDGQPYYTMRLIDGPDLADVLHRDYDNQGTPLSSRDQRAAHLSRQLAANWGKQVDLAIQAARALEHAHSQGILHRDVKPANLLIDEADNLWVTDFGLAKQQLESGALTVPSKILGTPRYMAPEQLRSESDERSDIFGLGLVMYELAILRTDTRNQRTDIWRGGLRSPRHWNPSIPKTLARIIQKAVHSDPASRYQTAAEFADDLERFRSKECQSASRNKTRADGSRLFSFTTILCVGSLLLFGLLMAAILVAQGRHTASKNSAIGLTPAAENAPDFSFTVVEGQTRVALLERLTPSVQVVELSGLDASRFRVDHDSNSLLFSEIADFESPSDTNFDNVFEINLVGHTRTWSVQVEVADLNEPPSFDYSMFQRDGSTIKCSMEKAAGALILRAHDDNNSVYDGLTFSATGGPDRTSVGVTPPGIFIFTPPPQPGGGMDSNGDLAYDVELTVSDRTYARFARLEKSKSGHVALIRETLGPRGTISANTWSENCEIGPDVIDIATTDGRTFFHIHRDHSGTASLYVSQVLDDGRFIPTLLNSNCGISQDARGFATSDGTTFYYLTHQPQRPASLSLHQGALQLDGSFESKLVTESCNLSPQVTCFSWLDSNRFQHIRASTPTTAVFAFSFLDDSTFSHLELHDESDQYGTSSLGHAA